MFVVMVLPLTEFVVSLSTCRTKLTLRLSKQAGGWNGNPSQCGGGGDGGEGGGDGVGGGDGGDGGGDGGGHVYTSSYELISASGG